MHRSLLEERETSGTSEVAPTDGDHSLGLFNDIAGFADRAKRLGALVRAREPGAGPLVARVRLLVPKGIETEVDAAALGAALVVTIRDGGSPILLLEVLVRLTRSARAMQLIRGISRR